MLNVKLKTKKVFFLNIKKFIKNRKIKNKNFRLKFRKSILSKNLNFLGKKIYSFQNLFNFNFIRKEKIYTKLKYSRTPQYDIVSGGVAAIFSGFLGFLICEKFGLELLDSGDFYFLFMYFVIICFFVRLFFKICNDNKNN